LIDKKRRLIDLLEEKRTATITQSVTKGLDPTVPMKPSNIPWIGDIPAHWDIQRLAMVMQQMTNGFVGPTRDILVDEGVRYIQSLHVKEGLINFHTPYFVSPEWSQRHSRTILGVGDILLVQTGDIGQSAVVGADIAGANCHALIIMRMRDALANPEYFGFALRSISIREAILETRTGALHPHLNVGSVRDVKVPVPPQAEQGAISDYLSNYGQTTASAIAAVTPQLSLLSEYREALITAAVTGEIDVDTFNNDRSLETVTP
jgi:type I restriction enzyme S subunit